MEEMNVETAIEAVPVVSDGIFTKENVEGISQSSSAEQGQPSEDISESLDPPVPEEGPVDDGKEAAAKIAAEKEEVLILSNFFTWYFFSVN